MPRLSILTISKTFLEAAAPYAFSWIPLLPDQLELCILLSLWRNLSCIHAAKPDGQHLSSRSLWRGYIHNSLRCSPSFHEELPVIACMDCPFGCWVSLQLSPAHAGLYAMPFVNAKGIEPLLPAFQRQVPHQWQHIFMLFCNTLFSFQTTTYIITTCATICTCYHTLYRMSNILSNFSALLQLLESLCTVQKTVCFWLPVYSTKTFCNNSLFLKFWQQ